MRESRALPLALGALAVTSGIASLSFDIIFAVTLSRAKSTVRANSAAIVASGLGSVNLILLLLLLFRQIGYRSGAHIQDSGHGRQHTHLLAAFTTIFGVLAAVASAVLLGIVRSRLDDLQQRTIRSPTLSLIVAAFTIWAIFLVLQALFVVCMVLIQRKDFQEHIRPYHAGLEPHNSSEMQERSLPEGVPRHSGNRGAASMESKSPRSSSGRSRSGSETIASVRSSFQQVVRPITSKTKLIASKPPYRPPSIDTSREPATATEDGFDSWDTSAVDAQSRQVMESASPTPPRFLETIPASPTTSRSPSPGFPLDLAPPKPRRRSRSYSPVNSMRDASRTSRTASPTESLSEAHIHPLFRSDSPTPAPTATPGTVVTAAPGAGQLISDRPSIRSIHRMRSGSLPSSPLAHSASLDSMRHDIRREEREEHEKREGTTGERTLTPPIPDWILGQGPRSSVSGRKEKKNPAAAVGVMADLWES